MPRSRASGPTELGSADCRLASYDLAIGEQRDRLGADQHPGDGQGRDPEAEAGLAPTGDAATAIRGSASGAVAGPVINASVATPRMLTAVSSHIHSKPRLTPYATNTAVSAAVVTPLPRHPPGPPYPDSGCRRRRRPRSTGSRRFRAHRGLPGRASGRPGRSTRTSACCAHQLSYVPAPSPRTRWALPLVERGRPELPAAAPAPAQQVRPDEVPVIDASSAPGNALKPLTRAAGSDATIPTSRQRRWQRRRRSAPPARGDGRLRADARRARRGGPCRDRRGRRATRRSGPGARRGRSQRAVHELVTLEEHRDRGRRRRPATRRARRSAAQRRSVRTTKTRLPTSAAATPPREDVR